jgi:fructan beta-fructosidase
MLARTALVATLIAATAGTWSAEPRSAASATYAQPLRPQLHFSPPAHWMNDPNGLVWSQGEYHLFYQYHPASEVWGPMHWGHAVSRDLLHWQQLPVALAPDARGMIFSGSVVADSGDTSGLGRAGRAPLVALFTYHDEALKRRGGTGYESQGLAWSLDAGRHWTKYAGNPVLAEPGSRDFRDPKVVWHEPTQRWIMALAAGDHVAVYSSPDLRHWRHESDFGAGVGAHGGVWECPDLLPIALDDRIHWLLLVSVAGGAPNGGTGTQYFVGDFDGRHFSVPAAAESLPRWVDYGRDDYAGSTWTDGPPGDARTLFLGWMSNWEYAMQVPTAPWRSAMTVPRELSLTRGPDGLMLRQAPAQELAALRRRTVDLPDRDVRGIYDLSAAADTHSDLLELELRARPAASGFSVHFTNGGGEEIILRVEPGARRYVLDRSRSGAVAFDATFADAQAAPMATDGSGLVDLHALIDHGAIELYLDHGVTVMTALAFPHQPFDRISLESGDTTHIDAARIHELRSIWP